MKIWISHQNL